LNLSVGDGVELNFLAFLNVKERNAHYPVKKQHGKYNGGSSKKEFQLYNLLH
jgi:hypothetical protein